MLVVSSDSDIDSCVGVTSCEQLCINEEGPSYHCACSEGYRLNADGFTCSGIIVVVTYAVTPVGAGNS